MRVFGCCISRLKRETDSEQRKNGQTEIASRALNPFCFNTSPNSHVSICWPLFEDLFGTCFIFYDNSIYCGSFNVSGL